MNVKQFDVIVVGVGSMGSAACYFLSQQGLKVLGLEQFSIPNEKASHAGQSRIIRKAYFEHLDYVPLLERAYQQWNRLERETGEQVFFRNGILYHGPSTHPVIEGVRKAGESFDIPLQDTHPANEFFHLRKGQQSIFEPNAGFLLPHKSIELYTRLAISNGVVIRENEKTIEWKKAVGRIIVKTAREEYHSKKLVITSGAWTSKFVTELRPYLRITRQLLCWFRSVDSRDYLPEKFPCWLIADEKINGALYGFPYLDSPLFGEPRGLKAAVHFPAENCDPDDVNRTIHEYEKQALLELVNQYLPGMKEVTAAKICLYANSPDEHFIIDFLPGYDEQVIIACGFSGHGFKFVPVVAEAVSDLVINGRTSLPIGFLSLNRFK